MPQLERLFQTSKRFHEVKRLPIGDDEHLPSRTFEKFLKKLGFDNSTITRHSDGIYTIDFPVGNSSLAAEYLDRDATGTRVTEVLYNGKPAISIERDLPSKRVLNNSLGRDSYFDLSYFPDATKREAINNDEIKCTSKGYRNY